MTKLVAPHIAKEGGGVIDFNGSCSGYRSPPGVAAYAVTKTTMIGLTRALAMGLAKDNIRVNGVAPGVKKTKMSEMVSSRHDLYKNPISQLWKGDPEAEKEVIDFQGIVLGRLGMPEDCTGAAAFSSEDASYITGEMIIVSGGVQARL
ncbi:hypothetical protein CAEBREN_01504 [Caenorhabditis brenneri]|uniref:Uncharacterized protein n=1 Tax=Caenorhabditis brenneri TaxID=135651 RepID=G0N961_CAEBE|nr:hypothetical protein CAEBREN_01504 [Caenorhabditis brenneri]